MAESPLVSVIAGSFNHARFVRDCLESIRAQTYGNTELIIIDDHSTDDTVAIINDWLRTTGVTATVIVQDENQGICRTRNEALSHATGKYVACISTDDMWLPDKLERHVKEMEALPDDVAVLYSDAYRVDESGNPIEEMFIEPYLPNVHPPPSGDVYELLLENNFIPSLTTLVRRSAFLEVGPYDESLSFEDWDMWLRVAQRFKFAYSPVPSARYRIVSNSLDHTLRGTRRRDLDASKILIQLKHLGHAPEFDRLLGFRTLEYLHSLYQLDHPQRDSYVRLVVEAGKKHRLRWLSFLARWAAPNRRVWALTLWLRQTSHAARVRLRRRRA